MLSEAAFFPRNYSFEVAEEELRAAEKNAEHGLPHNALLCLNSSLRMHKNFNEEAFEPRYCRLLKMLFRLLFEAAEFESSRNVMERLVMVRPTQSNYMKLADNLLRLGQLAAARQTVES